MIACALYKSNSIDYILFSFLTFKFSGQNVQVVQFPAMQQTVPVQVPISTGNGQTIYQTVHVPLQTLAGQMPGLVQPQMQIFPQLAQVLLWSYHTYIAISFQFISQKLLIAFPIGCKYHYTEWSDTTSSIGSNESIAR